MRLLHLVLLDEVLLQEDHTLTDEVQASLSFLATISKVGHESSQSCLVCAENHHLQASPSRTNALALLREPSLVQ